MKLAQSGSEHAVGSRKVMGSNPIIDALFHFYIFLFLILEKLLVVSKYFQQLLYLNKMFLHLLLTI